MGKHSKNEGPSFRHGIPVQRDDLLLRQQIEQEEKSHQNAAPQSTAQFTPSASVPLFGRKKEILRLREEINRRTDGGQSALACR